MEIHIGTSGYGHKEWKGVFYPEKIQTGEMLRFYAERFTAVEINYTFHHMPTEKVLSSWTEKVPDNFIFALKAPQVITHLKRLHNVDEECGYFFRTIAALNPKTGPVLFQFPPGFRINRPLFEDFLALIPENVPCAFEFRNSSWLEPGIHKLLQNKNYCLCTADADEKPADEIISTATWGYLRLRRPDYTEADLTQWKERILARKWKRAFVFFKHEKVEGPETAMRFQEIVNTGRKKIPDRGMHAPAEKGRPAAAR